MNPEVKTPWREEDGCYYYLIDTASYSATYDESVYKLDCLLRLMNKLGILEYNKFYEDIYEIRIKKRD